MEQTIETLLKDFEDGKMNRRQLIKHLAMAASLAAPAAAVASPAVAAAQRAPAQAPWKTVHLDHISYSAGVKVTSEPRPLRLPNGPSINFAYVAGPSGARIEIVERPGLTGQ